MNAINVAGTFVDNVNGTYTLTYTVANGETDWTAGNLPISCQLQDPATNTVTTSAWTDGNTLAGDANMPTLSNWDLDMNTGSGV